MFRVLFNIILILIICFSASTMPISSTYFELPFDLNKEKPIEEINFEYKTNLNEGSINNPTNIEFIMLGQFNKENLELIENQELVLEVYKNDALVKKYLDNEIVKDIDSLSIDNGIKYTLDISKNSLELGSGDYRFKIYSTLEDFSDTQPYELAVSYLSDSKYIGSKNEVEKGYMYLKLYFTDKQAMYLVPVSRKIPYTRSTIGATIENLYKGPDSSLGLSEGSPIPKILGKNIRGTTAIINLPSSADSQGSTEGYINQYSFINSLTSIYGVDSVQFLVDGKRKESFFHGSDISKPLYYSDFPRVYLALDTDTKKFLLVPVEITDPNIDDTTLVKAIFDSLKGVVVNDYEHSLLTPTIPSDVRLIDWKVEESIITLNLSEDFFNAYKDREDLQKMMLDSILYSFTSIKDINKVLIKIEGKEIDSFSGVNISQPMFPPEYINIEK